MATIDAVPTGINHECIQRNLLKLGGTIARWSEFLVIAREEIDNVFTLLPSTVPFKDDLSAAKEQASKNCDRSAENLAKLSVFHEEFTTHLPHDYKDLYCDDCWRFQEGGAERLIAIAKSGVLSVEKISSQFQKTTELHLAWMAQ